MRNAILLTAALLFAGAAQAQFVPKIGGSGDSSAAGEGDGEDVTGKAYAGLDYLKGDFSSGTGTVDLNLVRARAGYRLFKAMSIEAQYGASVGTEAGGADVDSYFAIVAVPTVTVFEAVELSLPVGVSKLEVFQGNRAFDDFDLTYGIHADVPLSLFELPDVRLGAGFTVLHNGQQSRSYGFNVGVRYDFDPGEFEFVNPVAAVRGLFGGGAEAPAAASGE